MLKACPTTLDEANSFVGELHRHHDAVVGHRFSFGASVDGKLVGTVIVGRPVAPKTEQYKVAEVTRLCTDGTPNACSFLYGAAAKVCRIMGFRKIQTFILPTESGISLKAAGWVFDGVCHSSKNGFKSRPGRKSDYHGPKHRWIKHLNDERESCIPKEGKEQAQTGKVEGKGTGNVARTVLVARPREMHKLRQKYLLGCAALLGEQLSHGPHQG